MTKDVIIAILCVLLCVLVLGLLVHGLSPETKTYFVSYRAEDDKGQLFGWGVLRRTEQIKNSDDLVEIQKIIKTEQKYKDVIITGINKLE